MHLCDVMIFNVAVPLEFYFVRRLYFQYFKNYLFSHIGIHWRILTLLLQFFCFLGFTLGCVLKGFFDTVNFEPCRLCSLCRTRCKSVKNGKLVLTNYLVLQVQLETYFANLK